MYLRPGFGRATIDHAVPAYRRRIGVSCHAVADTAVVPLQDVLGEGAEARMNLPGRPGGNWRWRFGKGALTPDIRRRLRLVTEGSGRI